MSTTKTLDLADFDQQLHKVFEMIQEYTKNITHNPVAPRISYSELTALLEEGLPTAGMDMNTLFDQFHEKIVPHCVKMGHPRFLAWLLTSPSPAGTLGELLSVAVNQIPAMDKSSPSATVVEELVIKWFGEMFGYQKNFGGILTSGGTAATIIGLTVAREVHFPGAMKQGLCGMIKQPVMYVSDQGHSSIERAAAVLGIGSQAVRRIPTDSNFKMDIKALEQAIKQDKAAGFAPFCVVAQVGSTNTGSVDPIKLLADLCAQHRLWLHIDAAYGGGAILTTAGHILLEGIEQADSIATDPHKWFFTPAEAGCVLIKNKQQLYDTFKGHEGSLADEAAPDLMNYGLQCTRDSKAFKIWFAFKAYGLHIIAQIVEQNMAMAQSFKNKLAETKGWHILAPVALSAVCFRYVPDQEFTSQQLDELQLQLLKVIEDSGEAFFTAAVLRGTVVLRVCFANHRTTMSDMEMVIGLLNKAVASTMGHSN
jgi:aromatic-L-amino-acid decarboxylase